MHLCLTTVFKANCPVGTLKFYSFMSVKAEFRLCSEYEKSSVSSELEIDFRHDTVLKSARCCLISVCSSVVFLFSFSRSCSKLPEAFKSPAAAHELHGKMWFKSQTGRQRKQ